MPRIFQLDPHVADLIAAGEVVERPASAVKELVENAIDAGAKRVTVEIQNGGMSYLRVTDDGCGMSADDAETAFLRHATSKIRTEEDLAAIGTLGFRGEALAAIASVSKIDLLTKTPDGEGVSLSLEAGVVTDKAPAGCPDGTTIVVRDLFYNTPARMKFMKRDTVESSYVASAIQRQALAHPEVALRLVKDGETVVQTSGGGDLYATVYEVFGRQLANEMVSVKSTWEQYKLNGYITKPTATRGNRNYQQFFVNGRPVKSRLLMSALEQAYENRLQTGRFPGCVLRLELPRHLVDVNVHPAKTEVKFASEKAVFDAVYYACLSSLNKEPGRPQMTLPKTTASAPKKQETFQHMTAEQFKEIVEPATKPADPEVVRTILQTSAPVRHCEEGEARRGNLGEVLVEKKVVEIATASSKPRNDIPVPTPAPQPEQITIPMPTVPDYRIVGEVLDTYIIVEQADEVLLIDKHAAHERINFEKLKQTPAETMSQLLLTPLTVSVTAEEAAAVAENRELLCKCGFDAEEFGPDTLLLRQIPADMDETAAAAALQAMAADLLDGKKLDPDALHDKLLHTVACKASIKAGWHTDPAEREALVKQVLTRDDIKYCPHGRPVTMTLTKTQIEKQFKR